MAETVEIDLKELAKVLWKRAWIIAICIVLVATSTYIYTKSFVKPLYTASVTIYVNTNSNRNNSNALSSGDLAVALRLVNTYVNIIKSDSVLSEVVETTGTNLTPEKLRKVLSAEAVEETEMFRVSVTTPNAQMSADIANTIATVAPAKIAGIIEGSSAKVIDYASVPKTRSSPSYTKNTIIGGVIGAVLAIAGIAVQMLLDTRIKKEEDLTKICALPILGKIPEMTDSKSQYGKAGR